LSFEFKENDLTLLLAQVVFFKLILSKVQEETMPNLMKQFEKVKTRYRDFHKFDTACGGMLKL